MSDEPFLSRWSRRKAESAAGTAGPTADSVPVQTGSQAPVAEPPPAPEPLPDVDSLTPESDFAPFMKADVDPALRRSALKKLLADPRFNVMDGLDVYIDDYSKADPLPEGWLEKMNAVRYLGIFRKEEEEPAAPAASEDAPVAGDAMHAEAPAFPESAPPLDTSGDGKSAVAVPEKPQGAGGS